MPHTQPISLTVGKKMIMLTAVLMRNWRVAVTRTVGVKATEPEKAKSSSKIR